MPKLRRDNDVTEPAGAGGRVEEACAADRDESLSVLSSMGRRYNTYGCGARVAKHDVVGKVVQVVAHFETHHRRPTRCVARWCPPRVVGLIRADVDQDV